MLLIIKFLAGLIAAILFIIYALSNGYFGSDTRKSLPRILGIVGTLLFGFIFVVGNWDLAMKTFQQLGWIAEQDESSKDTKSVIKEPPIQEWLYKQGGKYHTYATKYSSNNAVVMLSCGEFSSSMSLFIPPKNLGFTDIRKRMTHDEIQKGFIEVGFALGNSLLFEVKMAKINSDENGNYGWHSGPEEPITSGSEAAVKRLLKTALNRDNTLKAYYGTEQLPVMYSTQGLRFLVEETVTIERCVN